MHAICPKCQREIEPVDVSLPKIVRQYGGNGTPSPAVAPSTTDEGSFGG